MSSHLFRVTEHTVPAQHIREYPHATNGNQNEVLDVCVKRYTPLHYADEEMPEGAVTLIGAHANGFPKEIYEPLWDEVLERSRGKFHIRSIWIADISDQGDSYVRNEGKLGGDPSWFDSSRDLLQIINTFRSQMPRPLVGIGHSFGGAQLVNLALFHPRLFASLILLDPPLVAGSPTASVAGMANPWGGIYLSTFRRDLWSNLEEARQTFSRNPFYQSWDARVFEAWIQHGLRELPTALYPDIEAARELLAQQAARRNKPPPGPGIPVTLKTSKHEEVMTFVRPNFKGMDSSGQRVWDRRTHPDTDPGQLADYPFYRIDSRLIFRRLPSLRPPTLYILGGDSNISPASERQDKVTMTGIGLGGNGGLANNQARDVPGLAGLGTKGITLEGIGHLVPMEATKDTAQHTTEWLTEVVAAFRWDEEQYRREMLGRGVRENLMVSKEFEHHISTPPGPGSHEKPKL